MRGILIFMVLVMLIGMAGAAQIDPAKQINWDKIIDHNINLGPTYTISGQAGQNASILALGNNDTTHDADILGVENNDTSQEAAILALGINDSGFDASVLALGINDSTHDSDINDLVAGNTAQNKSISALIMAAYTNETAINVSVTRHERSLVDNVSPSILALQGYVPHLIAIAGGAAGDHVVTGVTVGDQLGGVLYVVNASPLNTVSDLMAEFTGTGKGITAADTIANGGGTDTTGGFLIMSWVDKTA